MSSQHLYGVRNPDAVEFVDGAGYWRLRTGTSIAYSEGKAVERRLLGILEAASDHERRSGSPSLMPDGAEWELEYHLSPNRRNIVAGLEIAQDANIMEIGAGCGAITRYLGESTGGKVVAIEGAESRARICAARTRGLSNTQVLAAPLDAVELEPEFDVVVAIGVLEYSALFSSSEVDPFGDFLERCISFLKPGGAVVVAIENQLGLKYLAGAPEDHTAITFDGVHGYLRRPRGPRTFGRLELERLFRRSGLHPEFLFPYPDYKFPMLVLSNEAIDELDVSSMITNVSRSGVQRTGASEQLMVNQFVRNGLAKDVANSFMVVGHTDPSSSPVGFPDLGIQFSRIVTDRPERVTKIQRDGDRVIVGKRATETPAARWPGPVQWRESETEWVDGHTVEDAIVAVAASGGDVKACANAARPWLDHLNGLLADGVDSGELLDATWSNCVVGTDGAVHFIDREWTVNRPIDLTVPLFTSISGFVNRLTLSGVENSIRRKSEGQVRREFAAALGLRSDRSAENNYEEVFAELQLAAFGTPLAVSRESMRRRSRFGRVAVIHRETAALRNRVSEASELNRRRVLHALRRLDRLRRHR